MVFARVGGWVPYREVCYCYCMVLLPDLLLQLLLLVLLVRYPQLLVAACWA